jgi:hypothetical protein
MLTNGGLIMQTANHTAINTLPRLAQVALPVSVPTIGLDLLAFVGKTRSAIDGAVPYRVRYHCCGREETITAATVAGRGRTHRASLCQVCARKAKAHGRKGRRLSNRVPDRGAAEMDFVNRHWKPPA